MDLSKKPFYLSKKEIDEVNNELNSLTIEEKVHQMFCVLGDCYTKDELINLVKAGIGGVLFRPIKTMKEINSEFIELDSYFKIPLLHASNLEEGGSGGARDGTFFSSQLGVGATNNIDDLKAFALATAYEGIKTNINWTFSPVSDLNLNYRNPIINCRSYGDKQNLVKDFTNGFVEILQAKGIACCAKHFPGDGVDYRDQHLAPTYNTLSSKKWRQSYGRIYKNMINNGLLSIMVGHIVEPALEMEYNKKLKLEDCLPASLSKELLTDVLRGELKFNGLICSDATIMGGYTMALARKEAIPTSFNSGIDMLVFSTDIYEDIEFTLEAIKNNKLSIDRVNEAVSRILALKKKVCKLNKSMDDLDLYSLSRKVASDAITLVKNNSNILPISLNKYKSIRLEYLGSKEDSDKEYINYLMSKLVNLGYKVELYNPFEDDLHGVNKLSKDRLTLVVLNYPPASNQVTVRVSWCPKHALEIPRFVNEEDYIYVSFANPYHLQDIPRTKVYINCYTFNKPTIDAFIDKLIGKEEFKGINPIDPYCGLFDTKF